MASLTELTYDGTLAASTLFYAVLDHETSAVSRSTSLVDLETAMTNKLNTLANQGTGFPVFRERSSGSGVLRTLVGGNNISLSSATSTVTIAADSASQAAANLGAGGFGVFKETQANTHQFKTLAAGANITLSSAASTVTITGAAGGGGGEANLGGNVGTGFPVFREKSSVTLNFRTLVGGADISISSATSTITIANAASEKHFSVTIGASNTWNNDLIPIWQAPRGGSATIVEVLGTTSGTAAPSVAFNLQHRDWNAMAAAGTDIFAASQTATSAGEIFSSFARDTIDPRGHLMFTTGSGAESGSANYLQLTVYYTI